MRQLQLLDTSILVELLQVPGECARHDTTLAEFDARSAQATELQMPVAAIVEAGAHVGRIANGHERRACGRRFVNMVRSTVDRVAPWSFTPLDWDVAFLSELIAPTDERAPEIVESLSKQFLEMGDLLIVAEFRRVRANLDPRVVDVDVWTYDGNLRAIIDSLRSRA